MRTSALVLAIALGFVSSASASPIYRYGINLTDGTNTATGVVTMTPYDFPAGWGDTVCAPCDPNAIITDIDFTSLSPDVAKSLAFNIDLGPFTAPGSRPTYTNFFTLDADGDVLSGLFNEFGPCDLSCGHIVITPGSALLFAAYATFSEGIVTEVTLRGPVDVDPVPEPGSVALLGMAVIGFLGVRRRTIGA